MPHIYLDKHQGRDMSAKKFYIYLVDLPFSEALIPVDSFEVGDNFAHLSWSSTLVFVSFRWSTVFLPEGVIHLTQDLSGLIRQGN